MDFRAGERAGAFEILGPLGAGGMGEVYRARDSRLGREVALKVLPRSVSQDAERLARFDREARLLAALNHPGIGAIYGVEDSPRGLLLILELVPGDTLAERIGRGPLPIAEALTIGRQIADAVAFAHTNGVVHRDLKPANVKCTPQGVVKVLDFGLAKVLAQDSGAGSSDPTITPVTTQDGAILGTPAYMSPEQARAKDIDRRTDIWSFGCILYELLTGRRAFQRETLTDTLVAVLGEEPDWALLPPLTPPALHSLLRRCLHRDRDRRLHDMADVRNELDEVLAPSSSGTAAVAAVQSTRLTGLRPFELIAIGVIVLAMVIQAIFLWRLVPSLAVIYASFGMTLSLPLRLYTRLSNDAVVAAPILLLLWGGLRLSGRRVPIQIRGALLGVAAALSVAAMIFGLYFMAVDGLVQAMRLSLGGPSGIVDRDVVSLYLASGDSARVIEVLDPKGGRDDFAVNVTWRSPGDAFQLAEAYRAQGNVEAARRLYRRAQEAAVKFDEVLVEQLRTRQIWWQGAFGRDVSSWAPSTSAVRRLPDLIRTVSQQRLDQLDGKAP